MTQIIYRGAFFLSEDVKVYITISLEPSAQNKFLYFAHGWVRKVPMHAATRIKVVDKEKHATIFMAVESFMKLVHQTQLWT